MGFDTTQVTPGGAPNPGVLAGTPVPAAAQRAGTAVSITFEATRVTTFPPGTIADYNQPPVKILVNNYSEVNELNFIEFSGKLGCCTPIDATLSVQYTVDHADMDAGGWSVSITSCSPSAPGDITPTSPHTNLASGITAAQTSFAVASSAGFPGDAVQRLARQHRRDHAGDRGLGDDLDGPRGSGGTAAEFASAGAAVAAIAAPGVTNRGGAGTIPENTSGWSPCSYTVWLTTRPGLTNGLIDRTAASVPLTFCICGH